MKQNKRHDIILYAVMRNGYISIKALSDELGVSEQTIRRDLDFLDRNGMLERRPGGASVRTTILNRSYEDRRIEEINDKERIARAIAEYLPDYCSVFLTLGTTTEVIANALLERTGLMIVTNNVVAALTLNKKSDFEVVLTSGYMRKSSHGLVGASTIASVEGFQCDFLVTSTGGINEDNGYLVDFHNADVSVAQAMMKNSKKTILAASRGKFGRHAVIRFAPMENIDVLVTCTPVPERLVELTHERNVELISC
ncbi:MAG: DeoR/GlpR transcriptional regulator [Mailhella sp.]|nr:DeoR/GlpR transcriptional regulator [Mailhella sp.]